MREAGKIAAAGLSAAAAIFWEALGNLQALGAFALMAWAVWDRVRPVIQNRKRREAMRRPLEAQDIGYLYNLCQTYWQGWGFRQLAVMELQVQTGLRANEVLETWRWSESPTVRGGWQVQLEKSAMIRTIPGATIPPILLAEYHPGNRNAFGLSYWRYAQQMKAALAPAALRYAEKDPVTHIWRHLFARQYIANGFTLAQVAQELKIATSTAAKYIAPTVTLIPPTQGE